MLVLNAEKLWCKYFLLKVFFHSIYPRNSHTCQTHGSVLRIWKIHLQKTTAACLMMKNLSETQQDIKRTEWDSTEIWQCLSFPDSSSWMNTNGFGTTWKTGRGKEMNEWWRPFSVEEGSVWQPGHLHFPKSCQLHVVHPGVTACTDVQLWTEQGTKDCQVQLESSEYFDVTLHLVTWSIPKVFSSAWHIIKNVSGKIKFEFCCCSDAWKLIPAKRSCISAIVALQIWFLG